MKTPTFTRADAIALYSEIAAKEPEATKGSLYVQLRACKHMFDLGSEPAFARLNQLAKIDPARTKGNRRGQDAATKLLERLLSLVNVDETAKGGTNMTDSGKPDLSNPDDVRRRILAGSCEIASLPPDAKGGLKGQIAACKSLYEKGAHALAIQKLNEIANMDVSRTGGRQTNQKAAAKLLKELVGSIKVDKSGVQ